jgi:hypothetical protein
MRLDLPMPTTSVRCKTADGAARRALTEADAIDIWMARWLRVPIKVLVGRYACDSRRLYEVWWGQRFPLSRAKAEALFAARYPAAVAQTTFGYRRIPRPRDDDGAQQELFRR